MQSADSISARMLNVLAVPGEVFDEVVAAPTNFGNWRAPTLLTCLAGLIAYSARANDAWSAGEPLAGSIVVIGSTIIGSLWMAFVLWLMGRLLLKVHFSLAKALEVAGLAGTVIALGHVATVLLAVAFGRHVQPSLALLAYGLPAESGLLRALEIFNCFHLWSVAVLCIGLSKLARVSVKEASFWVMGYWVGLRLALIATS